MGLSLFELDFVPLLKTLLIFLIWLVIAPSAYSIDQRKTDVLNRMFRNLLQGLLFTSVIVYILVCFKIFEFISLFTVFLMTWVYAVYLRGGKPLTIIQDKTIIQLGHFFDWIEKPITLKERVQRIFSNSSKRLSSQLKSLSLMDIITAVFLIFIMGLRFYPRFKLLHLPMSDPYVHLTWAKMMIRNQVFPDGIYPMGYHTIIAAIQVLSHIDPYHILRFLGPIGGSLLVLGFYWFLRQITGNRFIALLGTIVFGLSTTGGLPVSFFRQITSLPMEFSIALVFPGLVFLNYYLCWGDIRDLYFFGFATADVCLIHSYGALFLALGTAVLVISAVLNRLMTFESMKRLIYVGFLGALLGFLPIILGIVFGLPWHAASTTFIAGNIKLGSVGNLVAGFHSLILGSPQFILAIGSLILVILIIASVYYAIISREKRNLWPFAVLLLSMIVLVLYFGPTHGGFSLMEPDRVEMFMSMSIIAGGVVALTLAGKLLKAPLANIGLLNTWFARKASILFPSLLLAIFSIAWITIFPLQLDWEKATASVPLEYDSAARNYFSIKNEFTPLDWTIIAPVEQYNEALGYGFTYELWKFSEDYTLKDAQNRNFDIPIPTTYMLIYVEKIPLQIWKNYVAPAGAGPTEKYYRSADGRAKLEEQMAEWCSVYMAHHKNMSVYYEDDVLRVYLVKHDPTPFVKK